MHEITELPVKGSDMGHVDLFDPTFTTNISHNGQPLANRVCWNTRPEVYHDLWLSGLQSKLVETAYLAVGSFGEGPPSTAKTRDIDA